jgi:hypothetical protein
MTASQERVFIRTLHLVLSIPILGYLYGPVAQIPQAAWFTRWIAMPLVILSGLWLWLKPRIRRWLGLVQPVRRGSPKQPAAASPSPLPATRSAESPPPAKTAHPANESAPA